MFTMIQRGKLAAAIINTILQLNNAVAIITLFTLSHHNFAAQAMSILNAMAWNILPQRIFAQVA
jgi:hypothetical protein